jgi:hypothetical protein
MTLSEARSRLAARGYNCTTFNDNVITLLARRVLGVAVDATRLDAIPAPTAHERFAARMAREYETSGIHGADGRPIGFVGAPGVVLSDTVHAPAPSGTAAGDTRTPNGTRVGPSVQSPPASGTRTAPTFVPETLASGIHGPGGLPLAGIQPGSLVGSR